ncbi:MAG: hypothetical protein DELT_01386 [Desulfovibrio sp.]
MGRPFFSLIVLVYKVEPFLRQCLSSIARQTFTDFEAIVVNDGSPDGASAICDEYAARDSRFRVVHQANGGIAKARKAGVALARGIYLGAVDGDDWIEPDMLERIYAALESKPADMVLFETFFNGPHEVKLGHLEHMKEGFYEGPAFEEHILGPYENLRSFRRGAVVSSLCTKVIKAELLAPEIMLLEDDFVFGEDAACVFLCLAKAQNCHYLSAPLYHYRLRPHSSTHSYDPARMDKTRRLRAHMRERLRSIRPGRFKLFPEHVYLRLLHLHIFIIYAYSGLARVGKWREIRRLLCLPESRAALRAYPILSLNFPGSLSLLMAKCTLPPFYCLVKPRIDKKDMFLNNE